MWGSLGQTAARRSMRTASTALALSDRSGSDATRAFVRCPRRLEAEQTFAWPSAWASTRTVGDANAGSPRGRLAYAGTISHRFRLDRVVQRLNPCRPAGKTSRVLCDLVTYLPAAVVSLGRRRRSDAASPAPREVVRPQRAHWTARHAAYAAGQAAVVPHVAAARARSGRLFGMRSSRLRAR
jgi:hypothetical protein